LRRQPAKNGSGAKNGSVSADAPPGTVAETTKNPRRRPVVVLRRGLFTVRKGPALGPGDDPIKIAANAPTLASIFEAPELLLDYLHRRFAIESLVKVRHASFSSDSTIDLRFLNSSCLPCCAQVSLQDWPIRRGPERDRFGIRTGG